MIWPRDRYFAILAGEGQDSALPALEQMAAGRMKAAAQAECRVFATEIIDHWKPRRRFGDKSSDSGRMLKLLARLDDAKLVERFLRDVFVTDFDGSEGKAHIACSNASAGNRSRPPSVISSPRRSRKTTPRVWRTSWRSMNRSVATPPDLSDERRGVCAALVGELVQVVEHWDAPTPTNSWRYNPEPRTGVVAKVVHILVTLAARDHLDRFLGRALADKRRYDLHHALIPDVKAIHAWASRVPLARTVADRLLRHCITELHTATAEPIKAP